MHLAFIRSGNWELGGEIELRLGRFSWLLDLDPAVLQ